MGVLGYYALGDQAEANVVLNLSPGPIRIVIEIMLLLHLISAFPILINPPCLYFEQLFKIPSGMSIIETKYLHYFLVIHLVYFYDFYIDLFFMKLH